MAIFLEKDRNAETYDFLELYLRRWQKEERIVRRKCSRRRLTSEVSVADDEEEDEGEEENDERELGQVLNREYFSREWHPYDWVKKAGTEVRAMPLCLFLLDHAFLTLPSSIAITVLLSI